MKKTHSFALSVGVCATAMLFAGAEAHGQTAPVAEDGPAATETTIVETPPAETPAAPPSPPAAPAPAAAAAPTTTALPAAAPTTAPPVALAPAFAPASAPSAAPAPGPSSAEAPALDRGAASGDDPARERRGRFVFIPKLGIGLGGSGELEETETCSGQFAGCSASDPDEYEDSSSYVLGADALFGVSRNFRLGIGALYAPNRSAEDGDIEIGSDLSTFAVAELVFDASPSLAIALRAQGGAIVLFPGGDLQDQIDSDKRACTSSTQGRCEVGEGPFPGFTYGFGAGVIAPLGDIAVRVDALYHAYRIERLSEKESSTFGGEREERETLSGHQVWLLAGLEL